MGASSPTGPSMNWIKIFYKKGPYMSIKNLIKLLEEYKGSYLALKIG